jgi:maltooligosyltrehalose trehalohydrolase
VSWSPALGAWPDGGDTCFRVWAPEARAVSVVIESGRPGGTWALDPQPGGYFGGRVEGAGPGSRYRYTIDGRGPFADPASRFQPDDVHGPSMVVDAQRFTWSDGAWRGVARDDLVIYELHVGTFSRAGTFRGVVEHLPHLRRLGVTAIELMPVADFPGRWNWGYDGVAIFAPARCYGEPDELRFLVDRAHAAGLGVLLDVVYNHVGPDGAALFAFSPWYFTDRHQSPWGAGVNLDGPHAADVRGFLIENALHWIHEYHLDGLRLDATHAMRDDSARHFLAELTAVVRESVVDREVFLIAEDHRNLAQMVKPEREGGWGLDGVWADDLHHQLRVALAGDRDGYYADYSGSAADIAATLERGWFFTGQYSSYVSGPRGTDPAGIDLRRFVVCLQNHDQVGNRALGERLHHQIDLAAWRAALVLLLAAPQTPLLFMGQEWAATTPFLYFTDHHDELGHLVTAGRRREFARFAAFADAASRERIPDPQARSTFEASRLAWDEAAVEPHASILRLHAALLALRQTDPAIASAAATVAVDAVGSDTIAMRRASGSMAALVVARLRGGGVVDLDGARRAALADGQSWRVRLTSEDPPFAPDSAPPRIESTDGSLVIQFERPSAVVLSAVQPEYDRAHGRTR